MFRSCIDRFRSLSFALYSCVQYIYVYMYVYIYICIYTYMYIYVYIYIYIYICMFRYVYIYIYTCIYTCIISTYISRSSRSTPASARQAGGGRRKPTPPRIANPQLIESTRHYCLGPLAERELQRWRYNGRGRTLMGSSTAGPLQHGRARGRPAFGAKRRRRSR